MELQLRLTAKETVLQRTNQKRDTQHFQTIQTLNPIQLTDSHSQLGLRVGGLGFTVFSNLKQSKP